VRGRLKFTAVMTDAPVARATHDSDATIRREGQQLKREAGGGWADRRGWAAMNPTAPGCVPKDPTHLPENAGEDGCSRISRMI